MRLGFLGRMSDMPLNGHMLQQPNSLGDMHRTGPHTGKQHVIINSVQCIIFLFLHEGSLKNEYFQIWSSFGNN